MENEHVPNASGQSGRNDGLDQSVVDARTRTTRREIPTTAVQGHAIRTARADDLDRSAVDDRPAFINVARGAVPLICPGIRDGRAMIT